MSTERSQTAAVSYPWTRRALREVNNALLDERDGLWAAGRFDAALAVDDARNKIAAAMHDLKRAGKNG